MEYTKYLPAQFSGRTRCARPRYKHRNTRFFLLTSRVGSMGKRPISARAVPNCVHRYMTSMVFKFDPRTDRRRAICHIYPDEYYRIDTRKTLSGSSWCSNSTLVQGTFLFLERNDPWWETYSGHLGEYNQHT